MKYIVLFLAVSLFVSCARSISFNSSTVVPAAEGKVKIKKDKNKNYQIHVKIKNLAESKNLNPPRSTYIVWMETPNNGTKNIGQLTSSNGILGGALKASLQTVTSFEPERFFITAEDNPSIEYPGYQQILSTGY